MTMGKGTSVNGVFGVFKCVVTTAAADMDRYRVCTDMGKASVWWTDEMRYLDC